MLAIDRALRDEEYPVKRWVLGWGEHAIVRAPEHLARRIHVIVRRVAEKYNNRPKL